MTAPTERDIDWLDNLQVEFLHGVPVYLPKEAKQAIQAHYKAKFEKLIGKDEELVPQKQMANPIANTVRIVRNEFRANLREKLKSE
jgi:hypothetical protein